ncbi:hypothetical protein C0Q70_19746 [Pomacea canaliculata]|uniref:Uncharacterized protein n=1 Tax=Pomacea canaliculata TaxID=400727 RepID=A0A2T7NDK7_POMCA|nr:hypothetical protein C0Q70_19746 [Pomacea canaliculata]
MKGLSTDIVYHIDSCTVLLWVNLPPPSAMCCGLSSDDEVPAVGPRGGGCGVDRLRATLHRRIRRMCGGCPCQRSMLFRADMRLTCPTSWVFEEIRKMCTLRQKVEDVAATLSSPLHILQLMMILSS